MNRVALLLAALMGGCASLPVPLLQGRDDPTFTLTVVYLRPSEVTAQCALLGAEKKNSCTVFDLDSKRCTVYTMAQRYQFDDERLALLGHEVTHCRYGRWHVED